MLDHGLAKETVRVLMMAAGLWTPREYPDGRIELRADGKSLAYEQYDGLQQVDMGARWRTSA